MQGLRAHENELIAQQVELQAHMFQVKTRLEKVRTDIRQLKIDNGDRAPMFSPPAPPALYGPHGGSSAAVRRNRNLARSKQRCDAPHSGHFGSYYM